MKKEMEIEIDFLGGNKTAKMTNDLMHAADMFERGKQLASYEILTITGNPDLSKLCEVIAESYKKAGGYAVFVAIRNVNGVRAAEPNAWFMDGVQSISMKLENKPLSWALFKDILLQLGYKAKTDEHMRVIEIKCDETKLSKGS